MYKVFIDNKELVLTGSWLKKPKTKNKVVCFEDFKTAKEVLSFRKELAKNKRLVVVCSDLENQFNKLFYSYRKISAAGGIVLRKSRILAIYRLEKWDLPKGKIEKNETPEIAAYREIEEECGISGMKLISPICETYHTYEMGGKLYLKRNYWFHFEFKGSKKLIPQAAEDISSAEWMKMSRLDTFEQNSYASILEVLKQWKKKFG